jgi:hypothetical protein
MRPAPDTASVHELAILVPLELYKGVLGLKAYVVGKSAIVDVWYVIIIGVNTHCGRPNTVALAEQDVVVVALLPRLPPVRVPWS